MPPSDAKGRSASMQVTVPPAMQRLATIIQQKDTLPFKTINDVARWCFYHGLIQLEKMANDKEVSSQFATLSSWVRTRAVELEQLEYKRHLDLLFVGIEKLTDNGHIEKGMMLAEMVWQQSDRIEDPYWREQFRNMAKGQMDKIRVKRRRRRQKGEDE